MVLVIRDSKVHPDIGARTVRVWRMRQPSGHPDLVLARAVSDGVIDQMAAALIGDTRLEGHPLAHAARLHGIGRKDAGRRRLQGERRLIDYLGHRSLVGLHQQRAGCSTED
jgi:hypothetical protein